MCRAARMAQDANDANSSATKRFRGFMFLFANIFMHELGHLFITYLNQGRMRTPTHIYPRVMGLPEGPKGEAGRCLETLLFGGVVCNYRNTNEDDDQVCS